MDSNILGDGNVGGRGRYKACADCHPLQFGAATAQNSDICSLRITLQRKDLKFKQPGKGTQQ